MCIKSLLAYARAEKCYSECLLYHDSLQKRTRVRSHYVSLEVNGNADVNQNGRDV